jgi:predicted small secreted protein
MKLGYRVLAGVLVGAVAAVVSGCNTVRGAGQDIERGGEAIQDIAR